MRSELFNVTVTDTFGGDANFSWVKRFKVRVSRDGQHDIDPADIAGAAIDVAGLSQEAYTFTIDGDDLTVTLTNDNVVVFVEFVPPPDPANWSDDDRPRSRAL